MERYNYLEAVTNDAKAAIFKNLNNWDFTDGGELQEKAEDELWMSDSVTGNASNSYTPNAWQAEENLCHNMDLLEDACDNCGLDIGDVVERGAKYCDVIIRCYLLPQAIGIAVNEMEKEGKIKYLGTEES